jgi:cytolysin (calcineurin-like family phosphatase)
LTWKLRLSRRSVLTGMAGLALVGRRPACAFPATDVTFLFINDVHACRTRDGLSPNCEEEGKTDENLLRHIRALNLPMLRH